MTSLERPTEWVTRRRVLGALSGIGLGSLAGCSSGSETTDTTAPPSDTATATPTAQPTTTEPPTATPTETPTETVDIEALESTLADGSFEGDFFDTHAHWAGARDKGHSPLDPATFATRMAEHDVGACVLFTSSVMAADEYPSVLQALVNSDVEYLPFLQPQSQSHLVEGTVTNVYADHQTAFAGIGEIIFYGGPMQGTSLTAEPWPTLFAFAAEQDIPLMIHPTQAQADGLKTMLADYPEATVMGHGGEFNLAPDTLLPILRDHDNLFWTVDAGSMLNGLVLTAADAADFVRKYDQQEGELKQLVEQVLPPIMDAAPDRVMWGTDLATDWNMDERVYTRVMDWTQSALDSLPADQRDNYAFANAKRLFGL